MLARLPGRPLPFLPYLDAKLSRAAASLPLLTSFSGVTYSSFVFGAVAAAAAAAAAATPRRKKKKSKTRHGSRSRRRKNRNSPAVKSQSLTKDSKEVCWAPFAFQQRLFAGNKSSAVRKLFSLSFDAASMRSRVGGAFSADRPRGD